MRTKMFDTELGNRNGIPNAAILITDGISNINSGRTVAEAVRARRGEHDIHIYAVGVGLTDTDEIDKIATPPASTNSFKVDSFNEL